MSYSFFLVWWDLAPHLANSSRLIIWKNWLGSSSWTSCSSTKSDDILFAKQRESNLRLNFATLGCFALTALSGSHMMLKTQFHQPFYSLACRVKNKKWIWKLLKYKLFIYMWSFSEIIKTNYKFTLSMRFLTYNLFLGLGSIQWLCTLATFLSDLVI